MIQILYKWILSFNAVVGKARGLVSLITRRWDSSVGQQSHHGGYKPPTAPFIKIMLDIL